MTAEPLCTGHRRCFGSPPAAVDRRLRTHQHRRLHRDDPGITLSPNSRHPTSPISVQTFRAACSRGQWQPRAGCGILPLSPLADRHHRMFGASPFERFAGRSWGCSASLTDEKVRNLFDNSTTFRRRRSTPFGGNTKQNRISSSAASSAIASSASMPSTSICSMSDRSSTSSSGVPVSSPARVLRRLPAPSPRRSPATCTTVVLAPDRCPSAVGSQPMTGDGDLRGGEDVDHLRTQHPRDRHRGAGQLRRDGVPVAALGHQRLA
jgi:hypothetical protein